MTGENLGEHSGNEHIEFWRNLQDGWDWFEEKKRPPNVTVEEGEYVFSES